MSRSGALYIIKAMEMAAAAGAGATAADTASAPARRAVDHQARAARPDRSPFSIVRRALTAMGHVRGSVSMDLRRRSEECAGAVSAPDRDVVLAGDQQIAAEAVGPRGAPGA